MLLYSAFRFNPSVCNQISEESLIMAKVATKSLDASAAFDQLESMMHALAYNLGNFLRTPALPKEVEH